MKAAVLEALGSPLIIKEISDPEPKSHELVIRVGACGICGTDLHMSENNDQTVGWRVLEPGCVMGHEFAGEVVEIGADASEIWRCGDRITALPWIGCGACKHCIDGHGFRCRNGEMRASRALPGAYSEYCRVGSHEAVHLPDTVNYTQGALVEPLAVGFNAIRRSKLIPGETVLIVGAGPVGLAVSLWCKYHGAKNIIITDIIKSRADRGFILGATHSVDASLTDSKQIAREVSGKVPDIIFDCVGISGSLQLAIDYATNNSRVVVVGLCMSKDYIFPAKALVKEIDINFSFIYHQSDFDTVIDLLNNRKIDVSGLISDTVDLKGMPDAFEALKRPNEQIKVMYKND